MIEGQTRPGEQPARPREIAGRVFKHENVVIAIVLVVLIVVLGVITHGLTVARANVVNVLVQSFIRGVASLGQAFVILTGGIDLSVGGIGLFSAILAGSMTTLSPWLNTVGHPVDPNIVLPLTLAVGAGWGMANGALVSRAGIPPLIVTLGTWQILRALAFFVCKGQDMSNQPASLIFFGTGKIVGVPVPVIFFVVVAVLAYFALRYSRFGRDIYAAGGNPMSAWLSGINVKRTQLLVYVVSGALAGLAGFLILARTGSATMQTLDGLELNSIAAVSIGGVSLFGGRGNLIGVVIGVLIMGVINNAMSVMGVDPSVQGIVTGSIVIGAVAVDFIRKGQR